MQDGDWIRFNFSLNLNMRISSPTAGIIDVRGGSGRVLNFPPTEIISENVPENHSAKYLTICCKPEILDELNLFKSSPIPSPLTLGKGTERAAFIHREFSLEPAIQQSVVDLFELDETGRRRYFKMESLVLDILYLTSDRLNDQGSNVESKFTEYPEQSKVESVETYLLQNLKATPTIDVLSRRFGLNRTKLFYAFKAKTGLSVTKFVYLQRMKKAQKLLVDGDLSIQSISEEVGYSHQSNFSLAFKSQYGCSPRELRQNPNLVQS